MAVRLSPLSAAKRERAAIMRNRSKIASALDVGGEAARHYTRADLAYLDGVIAKVDERIARLSEIRAPNLATAADVRAACRRARELIPRSEAGTCSSVAGVAKLGDSHEVTAAMRWHPGNPGAWCTDYTVKDLAGRVLYTNTSATTLAGVYVRGEAAIAAGQRPAHVDTLRMDGSRLYPNGRAADELPEADFYGYAE